MKWDTAKIISVCNHLVNACPELSFASITHAASWSMHLVGQHRHWENQALIVACSLALDSVLQQMLCTLWHFLRYHGHTMSMSNHCVLWDNGTHSLVACSIVHPDHKQLYRCPMWHQTHFPSRQKVDKAVLNGGKSHFFLLVHLMLSQRKQISVNHNGKQTDLHSIATWILNGLPIFLCPVDCLFVS